MEELIPEKMESLFPEEIQEPDPELFQDAPLDEDREFLEAIAPRSVRPEWVLWFLALISTVLFLVVLVLSLPHMKAKPQQAATQTIPVSALDHLLATAPGRLADEEDPESKIHETEAAEDPDSDSEPTVPPEPNPYGRTDFQYNSNNYLLCERQDSYPGIDVSAFQGEIDWQQVKDSGIRFAIIRMGYRGYGTGKLVEDEYAKANLEGATAVGMPIGVYFFSQALNIREVDEEIAFMLEVLGDYELDMPIILDWEIPAADARTAKMDAITLTALQSYFCETMTEKGYTPMVYFNWHMSNTLLHLHELEQYPFWLALYQDRMTFPWKVEMWQYTDKGRVPGIQGNVDINVYMP